MKKLNDYQMSQTPIEFLVEELQTGGLIPKDSIVINYIIEEAKKKETLEKQHASVVCLFPSKDEAVSFGFRK